MHPQSSPSPSVPGLMVDGRSPSPIISYAMPSPPLAPLQFTTAAATHSSKFDDDVRLPSINEALGDLLHPSSISSASDRHQHPHYLHSAMSMAGSRIPSVETIRALTPSSPHLHGSLSSSASPDVSGCSRCHHCSSMADATMINNSTATTTTSSITQSSLTHHHHHHHRQVTPSMSSSKNGTTITPSSTITSYTDKHHHMCQLPTPSPPSPIVAVSPSSQSRMTANTTAALPTNNSTTSAAEHTNYHHQPIHATATAATTSSASSVTFVTNSGVAHKKRPRRRPEEIERLYTCIYPGCTKAYGTLNHLNAHIAMQRHGAKRLPGEFEIIRKQYRAMKLQQLQQHTMVQSATSMHL